MFGNSQKKRNTNGKYVKYSLAITKMKTRQSIIPPITVAACSFKMINTASELPGRKLEGLPPPRGFVRSGAQGHHPPHEPTAQEPEEGERGKVWTGNWHRVIYEKPRQPNSGSFKQVTVPKYKWLLTTMVGRGACFLTEACTLLDGKSKLQEKYDLAFVFENPKHEYTQESTGRSVHAKPPLGSL